MVLDIHQASLELIFLAAWDFKALRKRRKISLHTNGRMESKQRVHLRVCTVRVLSEQHKMEAVVLMSSYD